MEHSKRSPRFLFFYFLFCSFIFTQSALLDKQSSYVRQNEDIDVTVNVENVGTPINSQYNEYFPSFIYNDRLLFFQSDRPDYGKEANKHDIWYSSEMTGTNDVRFQIPMNIGLPINTTRFEGMPILRKLTSNDHTPDTKEDKYEMYFVAESFKNGIHQNSDIFRSVYINNQWSKPEPIHEINTVFEERMPFISLDGSVLVFSSNRPGGYGKDDIWVSKYDVERQTWTKPKNLGSQINTNASEISPALYDRNQTLYYSSDREGGMGGYDIYMSEILRRESPKYPLSWSDSRNLGKPYNSSWDDERPILAHNRQYMYFSSNRPGGMGKFDIYRAKVINSIKAQLYVTLNGTVLDKFTNEPLVANIHVRNNDKEWAISTTPTNGLFRLDMDNHQRYTVRISKPGYATYESVLFFRDYNEQEGNVFNKIFYLEQLPPKETSIFNFETKPPILEEEAVKSENIKELPAKIKQKETKVKIISPKAPLNKEIPKKKVIKKTKKLKTKKITPTVSVPPVTSTEVAQEEPSKNTPVNFKEDIISDKTADVATSVVENDKSTSFKETEQKEQKTVQEATENLEPEVIKPSVSEKKKKPKLIASIYFDTKESIKIKESERIALQKIIDSSTAKPYSLFVVSGHTDHTETTRTAKIELSRKRALFIRNELIQLGLSPKRVSADWHSDTQPNVIETNDVTKQKNRRVDIYITQ